MNVIARVKFFSAVIISAVCLTAILANAQVKIVAGYGVTYFSNVNSEAGYGVPYGCGSNELKQMFSTRQASDFSTPQKISCTNCHYQATGPTNEIINDKVVSISDFAPSKFSRHTLAMGISRTPGKVMSIGENSYGQLGYGGTVDPYSSTSPHYFNTPLATGAKGIAAGANTSFIITSDNKLKACGYNYFGQLGIGTYGDNQLTWEYVKKDPAGDVLTNVKSVSAGMSHTLILAGSDSVYGCGSNSIGQLGLGWTGPDKNLATLILTGAKKIAAGSHHNIVLKTDGTVWGFGSSAYGQLLTSRYITAPAQIASGVSDIAAGAEYNLILKGDTLFAVGHNDYGQLGDNSTTDKSNFVKVATNVASMAAGYNHTVIQKTDGTFWACGNNDYGQLGDGTTESDSNWVQVFLPVQNIFPNPSLQYLITNLNSSKVLQPVNNDLGANVVQMPSTGLSSQFWKFVLGNGSYNIVNVSNGYYMDITGQRTDAGANNIVWTSNGGRNQNWTLIDAGNGTFNIQNQNSGLNLDITGASTADGAQDIQWTPHTNDNQKWSISEGFTSYYTVTTSAGANGSISPSGASTVRSGYSYSCTITPNSGYMVEAVIVDNVNQGSITSHTFNSVNANHTISATFKSSTSTFPDPTKWYKIATRGNTSLCLNVSGGSYANNTAVDLWAKSNVNQEFKFQSAGNGYYTISCRGNTNYSIDMGSNFANSQTLKLWTTDVNNGNQKFKLVSITGGYYRIETSNSGFSIDNWGAGGNGVKPALWTSSNTNANQQWVITVVP